MRRPLETRTRRLLTAVTLPLVLAIAAVLPTGVAFGETADTPITCGMVISTAGTYTLGSDLTCGTDGVVRINSATGPVTLDLEGHTLSNTALAITAFAPLVPI